MRYLKVFLLVVMMGGSFSSVAGNYEDAQSYKKEGRKLRALLALEKAAAEDGNVEAMFEMGMTISRAHLEPSFQFFAGPNYAEPVFARNEREAINERKANSEKRAIRNSFKFFAHAAYNGDARALPLIGFLCVENYGPCDGTAKNYPWAYMWLVLAGSPLNKTQMKFKGELGNKMTAAEREKAQDLAQEFQEFIKHRKTSDLGAVESCPESWKEFTREACSYFVGRLYLEGMGGQYFDGRLVLDEELRNEDVKYEHGKLR